MNEILYDMISKFQIEEPIDNFSDEIKQTDLQYYYEELRNRLSL